jgi:hypothetical protein
MVIQEELSDADHAQPSCVVTFTVPLPPDTLKDWLVGEIE